jgi:quinol monooxygenase YgiN
MTTIERAEPLPPHLAEASRIGREISITGKWVPRKKGSLFRKSAESKEMLREWEDIHSGAKNDPGVLSTEINHAVGEEAVLIHHVFRDAEALGHYFATTAAQHMGALTSVAAPELHLVRGLDIPDTVRDALAAKSVPVAFGSLLFGYVKDDYRRPDPETAIQVSAKWTCKAGDPSHLEELRHWWQRVGTDAYGLEDGLLRFEAYQVADEDALIIHETFRDTAELKFHLMKGTAEKYKKDIDRIAEPECYYFRGPVAWTIRTYSRFMHLPATYSSRGSAFAQPGGTMSEGTVA